MNRGRVRDWLYGFLLVVAALGSIPSFAGWWQFQSKIATDAQKKKIQDAFNAFTSEQLIDQQKEMDELRAMIREPKGKKK